MSQRIRQLVIVGGGAAGWLTAGVIAAAHRLPANPDLEVTLIESPDVKILGVGEGTWPSMRDTLRRMGVSETAFIRDCDASFKQASKFVGWVTGEADDVYYHPFAAPQGYGDIDVAAGWQELADGRSFADLVCFQPALCEKGRAPKQSGTPEFAAVANYAYHLDAGKFGEFLRRHCVERLGVRHLRAHVEEVKSCENGDIRGLGTKENGLVEGDLFIDCTGFRSLLLGEHYGIPTIDTCEYLFCDTALAVQVPYEEPAGPIASPTIATAQEAGWIWDIGLPTRRGVGHVFSSAHTTGEDAERALTNYVRRTAGVGPDGLDAPRRIDLKPGYRESFWHRNCVAVGISAGFVEPLEASALALIELSARMIGDELPPTRELMDVVARRFNERFTYRWERIVDFLKLHYVLSRRDDSGFWIENRAEKSIPPRLRELLALWRYRSPSSRDFYQAEEIFPAASYLYVLHGMGFERAQDASGAAVDAQAAARCFQAAARLKRKYLAGLPSNRELIRHVSSRGLRRV